MRMRTSLGAAGIAVLAVVCCAALPLLVAASLSAVAFALVGGIAVGAIALTAGIVLLVVWTRRRRACATPTPSPRR